MLSCPSKNNHLSYVIYRYVTAVNFLDRFLPLFRLFDHALIDICFVYILRYSLLLRHFTTSWYLLVTWLFLILSTSFQLYSLFSTFSNPFSTFFGTSHCFLLHRFQLLSKSFSFFFLHYSVSVMSTPSGLSCPPPPLLLFALRYTSLFHLKSSPLVLPLYFDFFLLLHSFSFSFPNCLLVALLLLSFFLFFSLSFFFILFSDLLHSLASFLIFLHSLYSLISTPIHSFQFCFTLLNIFRSFHFFVSLFQFISPYSTIFCFCWVFFVFFSLSFHILYHFLLLFSSIGFLNRLYVLRFILF